jgi:glycosyltransferase involved in cell wall biosynthesis
MAEINLSYVLTTFNKISFIRLVLENLILNKQADEEIIVIDGGSTDGTNEFLTGLKNAGSIDYLLSEKDKGEAHGFNKGFLLAKGLLIKIITDDDAFYFPAIHACKEYMLQHPDIDVMGSNTAVTYTGNYKRIEVIKDYQDGFLKWKDGSQKNFAFCMTPVMIRRSSLPLTGLFYIKSKIPDFEWTIRVTGYANIAWYTGFPVVNIINNLSSSANSYHVFKVWPEEWRRFVQFYDWNPPEKIMRNYPLLPVSLKIGLTRFNFKNWFRSVRRKSEMSVHALFVKMGLIKKKQTSDSAEELNFTPVYEECQSWLINRNKDSGFEFLSK